MTNEPVVVRQPMPISMRKGVIALLISCVSVLLLLLSLVIFNRSYLFHTDGLEWRSMAIGTGKTIPEARRAYKTSWKAELAFLAENKIDNRHVRIYDPVQSEDTEDAAPQRVIGYTIERHVAVYGNDDLRLHEYYQELQSRTLPGAELVSSPPTTILTFADWLFLGTIALATLCTGLITRSRNPFAAPPGMNQFAITIHLVLAAAVFASIWCLADQPNRSILPTVVLGICGAALFARWVYSTRKAWSDLGLGWLVPVWWTFALVLLGETSIAALAPH